MKYISSQEKKLGCYVHIPFCLRKCLFCSFTVVIGQEHRMADYVDALIQEIKHHKGKRIHSLYLGGGTPGYLSDDELSRLMDHVRRSFIIEEGAELTIETNPENVNAIKAHHLRRLGFTRVSLGVQTFDDRYLKFLGRIHNSQRAADAFMTLRESGFDNINVDLMYGFPQQSPTEIGHDLEHLIKLGSEHISLYTLTIEPQSKFYAKQMKLDDDERLAAHYIQVRSTLAQANYQQYEISNFSKQGFSSRHNSHYWQGGEYIGLGVAAHGYLQGRRYWNTDHLQDYLNKVDKIVGFEDIDAQTQVIEKMCFGLRTSKGIKRSVIPSSKHILIDQWIQDGFLVCVDDYVVATLKGQLVLDELSVRLI